MNKIEQLLEKYCPNGVEFKELKEIADFSQGIQIDVEKQFPDIQE